VLVIVVIVGLLFDVAILSAFPDVKSRKGYSVAVGMKRGTSDVNVVVPKG